MDDPPSASRTPSYAPPLRSTAGSTGSSDGEPPAGRLVQEQQQQQQQPTLPRRPAAGSNRLVDGTSSSYLPLGPPSRPGSASRMAAPHFAPTPPPVLVSGSSSASSSTAGQRRASATGPPPQPPPPPSAAAGSSSTSKTTKVKSKGKTRAPAKPKGLAARLVANGTSDEDSRSESDDDAAGRPDGKKKRKRVERACYSCRQRRSKCDGTQPCAVCVHAKVECTYPPPSRRVSMKYVEELERKLRDLENRGPSALAEERKPSLTSAMTAGSDFGSSSTAISDQLPGPSILAAGSLPPITRIGSGEYNVSQLPYASQWAPGPPRPGFDSHSYRSSPYQTQMSTGDSSAHHHRLMGDTHRHPAPPASSARWDQNPLATLADLTTTQTQMQHPGMRPPLLQSSLPGFGSNESGSHLPGPPPHPQHQYQQHHFQQPPRKQQQAFEPYPHPYHDVPQPPLVSAQPHQPYQAPTPQYTPPESDQSKSQGGQVSSSHGSASTMSSHRPSNVSAGQPAPRRSPSPSSIDESGEPLDPEQEVLKPVFEAERWERGGGDGKAADFVERAAARYSGRDLEMGKAAEPGHNIDQSVVEALAPSPWSPDMFVLPPRTITDPLVEYYYNRVHNIFPVLSWAIFRRQYVAAISAPEPQGGTRIKASEQIIRATIDLVLAIAAALRCNPGDSTISSDGFRRAQALVSVPHLLLMGNLPIIQYLLLLCFHSQSSSKGNLSANAAGLGLLMARGIQLDSREINETFAPEDARVRERVWFCALQMETSSSAMLFRLTTTTERDFDVLAPPSVVDDEGKLLKDPLRLGNNEAPKELGYFRELCSLVAIKAKIIRSLYMVQKADCFPDSTVVLQTEDLLLDFWEKVPNYLKIETAPDAALYRLQAHLLRCRYNNTRIMLYRPFLFHFCSAPNGTYPIPDSLRFNLARKSARVCLDCAIEQVDLVLSKAEEFMQGSFWINLGFLYTSSLVLLAHRLVNMVWPSQDKEEVEERTVQSIRKVMDYFILLGWYSAEGFPDGEPTRVVPPPNAIKTARRVYRIVRTIDKVIKRPVEAVAAAEAAGLVDQPDTKEKLAPSKLPPQGPVPLSRYARFPDPTIPPLHLAPPENIPFSDDAFMSSWIALMQPSYRDGDVIPVDFNPPVTPFDLSRQNLGTNTEGESAWQGWESLLGMGYFSNLMNENEGGDQGLSS